MRRVFFACALMIAAGATGPRAQSDHGTEFNPYQLDDSIVVTSSRFATPIREVASSVTVISRADIEKSNANLALDLLRDVPGVDIVRVGGDGQQTSIFMRGSNSNHVLVIVDGVEMVDPSGPNNAYDLAFLRTDNIERIEVLRGPQSVLYGSEAIGGVIRVFTRRGAGKPLVRSSLEGGSLGTGRAGLSVNGGDERADYSLSFSRDKTDGFSAVSEARGTTEADGYDNTTYTGTLGLRPFAGTQFRFAVRQSDARADLDKTSAPYDDPNYELESRERAVSGVLSYTEPGGLWTGQVGAYVTDFQRSAFDDPDENFAAESQRVEYDGRRIKFDWRNALVKALSQQVTGRLMFGVETENEEMEQEQLFRSAWGDYSSRLEDLSVRTTGLFGLAQVTVGDMVTLGLGGRNDDHDDFGSESTYRLTGALNLDRYLADHGLAVKLRGAYGTGFKAPSLAQLHDPSSGNPDLNSETSTGWEIGFDLIAARGSLELGATYFHNEFENLILAVSQPDFSYMMENVDEAESNGVEAYVSFEYESFELRMDATHCKAEDRNTGELLLRRPENKGSVSLSRHFADRIDLGASLLYVGPREDMDYSSWPSARVSLESYTLLNLNGSLDVWPQVQLFGRIENLLDREYEEVLTYGAAPRSAFLGVRISTGR